MEYDFLKQFSRRMKNIGMYAVLLKNVMYKSTLKQYGFELLEEQVTLVFAVMLFIMEQSLRDDICTMDDICQFADDLNLKYFHKNITYDKMKEAMDFVVNTILGNAGEAIYFDCYDFEKEKYERKNIRYISNKAVNVDAQGHMESISVNSGVRRTSYYMTEDGYNLLLGTLEIESNMKLTVQEMIFKLHLERAEYDKAVDTIKDIFSQIKIQLKKVEDAMLRIRHNALNYSVEEYRQIMRENLQMIEDTGKKFHEYEELVQLRVHELEEQNINIHKLEEKELENLANLKVIEKYLQRTISSHQAILNMHMDFKTVYDEQLFQITQMSLIKRFDLRKELYQPILEDASRLTNIEIFLNPLLSNEPDRIYNLNKALEYQKPVRKNGGEDTEVISFDEEVWEEERKERIAKKQALYDGILGTLLGAVMKNGGNISLEQLMQSISDEQKQKMTADIGALKTVVVELLREKCVDIDRLRKERRDYILEENEEFHLGESLLRLFGDSEVSRITAERIEDGKEVVLCRQENGRRIVCSNVNIAIYGGIAE